LWQIIVKELAWEHLQTNGSDVLENLLNQGLKDNADAALDILKEIAHLSASTCRYEGTNHYPGYCVICDDLTIGSAKVSTGDSYGHGSAQPPF
jgi:hypothetical protein